MLVAVIAAGVVYAWGMSRRRAWPAARAACFAAGLAVIGLAVTGPIADADSTDFVAHVVQHLLLAMVAPPLLVLGAPLTLLLQAGSRSVQTAALRLLRVVRPVTHPLVAWVVFGASMAGLYFTPLYAASLRHPWLHGVVHLHFLAAGLLFFWPLAGVNPGPRLHPAARVLYVLVALPFHAIVGLALTSGRLPRWTQHTLANQQAGGAAMMLGGDLITLAVLAVVLREWVESDRRLAARIDASAAR